MSNLFILSLIILLVLVIFFIFLLKKTKCEPFDNPPVGTKISVIIISYKRPQNLLKSLPYLNSLDIVDDIVVGHGIKVVKSKLPKVKDVDDRINQNKYFSLRKFLLTPHCKNDLILMLDDDLIPSEAYLNKIVATSLKKDRDNMYGYRKRKCNADGYFSEKYPNSNMVLTSLVVTSKQTTQTVSRHMLSHQNKPLLDYVLEHRGNGEDIFFNYCLNKYLKKQAVYVPGEVKHLDNSDGYSAKGNHYKVREQLCKRMYS